MTWLKNLKFLCIFFVVFVLNMQIAAQPAKYADGIIAVVGDKIITRYDFEMEKTSFEQYDLPQQDSVKLYCFLLKKLIIQKLMVTQAELDSLPLTEERVDGEIENRIAYFQRKIGSTQDLERYLGKSIVAYKEHIRPRVVEQLLTQEMQQKITGNVKVSPNEVKHYFDTLRKDSLLPVPEEVEVAQLIFEVPVTQVYKDFAKQKLEKLRSRIVGNNEDFGDLAEIYSMDPGSKTNKGLLPEFGRGEMVPEFERMAFRLKLNEVSEVFQSSFGFHIMRVISRNGERVIAQHILIKPMSGESEIMATKAKADSVYQLLNAGKIQWCDAVKKYSNNTNGNAGYCGYLTDEVTGSTRITIDNLNPEMVEYLKTIPEGGFTEPAGVKASEDEVIFRIIYLKSRKPEHKLSLVDDYARIQIDAENAKKQQLLEQWLEKKRKVNFIRINNNFVYCGDLIGWNSAQ